MEHRVDLEAARPIYRTHGFGNRIGLGDRPAVVVVDFFYGCTSEEFLGGPHVSAAVDRTAALLPAARAVGVPVIYSTVTFRDGNPLLLTVEGEFVVKNLVLISAALVVGTTIRRRGASAEIPRR